ncbi:MAG: hypothetical protein ACKVQU_36870 [Burkholderiales bacterium]
MSQFSYLQREWPVVFDDYAKAEAVIYGSKMARERFVDFPLEGRSGATANGAVLHRSINVDPPDGRRA